MRRQAIGVNRREILIARRRVVVRQKKEVFAYEKTKLFRQVVNMPRRLIYVTSKS
jgi:hypothetical protein